MHLVDKNCGYIATCYYGVQNKGIGWVLTCKEKVKIDMKLFVKKISVATKKRSNLYASKETTAFRVFNGKGDGIGGLTIDFFNGFYMVSWNSEGIYSFREDVYKALNEVLNTCGVYE